MSCDCPICKRHRKISMLASEMKDLGMDQSRIDFVYEISDELDTSQFDLDCIISGMDSKYISINEIEKELGISEKRMREFLEKRRKQNNQKLNLACRMNVE